MSAIKYYTDENGNKCVNLNVDFTLTVGIKDWSRIFQYSNRDLILKQESRIKLYDKKTGNVVAVYNRNLDKK